MLRYINTGTQVSKLSNMIYTVVLYISIFHSFFDLNCTYTRIWFVYVITNKSGLLIFITFFVF